MFDVRIFELMKHSDTNIQTQRRLPTWAGNVLILALIAGARPLSRLFDAQIDPYFLDLILRIGIAVILAVSLNLINGITGQFSLGHAGFMALGAYTCGVIMKHHPPVGFAAVLQFLSVTLLAGCVAAVAGLLIGIPTLRLRGDYLAIATLGFGEIIYVVLTKIQWLGNYEVGGAAGLHDIPAFTNFFWVFAWSTACVVFIWRLAYSAKGKAFSAVREDEIAAAAMGVDTTFYKVTAFIIGAFFAGVAGALAAGLPPSGNLAPGSFRFMKSVEIVVMVVLGGSGSITGAILAAVILTWLPEQLRAVEQWRMVIYSLLLIGMMLLRPEGLLGSRELWWTRKRLGPAGAAAGAQQTS